MRRALDAAVLASVIMLSFLGAAPRPPASSFPPAQEQRLSNGVVVVSQTSDTTPLVGAQIFLPAGLTQQPEDKAGVAGIAAALLLNTPVEGTASLQNVATALGASISYTLDPLDTRYYIESRQADFPRLLHDLRSALRRPAYTLFRWQQSKAIASADELTKNPLEAAYAMVREVRYHGTGFASPDAGSALSIGRVTQPDLQNFFNLSQRGQGTVIALEGAVSQSALDAVKKEFGDFVANAPPSPPNPSVNPRTHEVIAHRNIPSPWVAVAYEAPSVYSADFAAMLVIEALLGHGGDVHALAFTSNATAPSEYLGAYYQYEARPGSLIVFLDGSGANIDQAIQDLQVGIRRLRDQNLPGDLIDEAKSMALGNFYDSITSLSDESWLLGRSAASPDGVQFENNLPQRIASVSGADIRRVAKRYLEKETVAIVLPQSPQ